VPVVHDGQVLVHRHHLGERRLRHELLEMNRGIRGQLFKRVFVSAGITNISLRLGISAQS
jgi:hypothetical protein